MKREFTYRLDFYWKVISLYAVALICYALIRGLKEGLSSGRMEIVLLDPLLILLFAFVVFSALGLCLSWFMQRSLIISDDSITLRNRFRERTLLLSEISRMSIGREKVIKVRGAYKLVKIRLNSRRRLLRIRTSSFHHEHELVEALTRLKNKVQAQARASRT